MSINPWKSIPMDVDKDFMVTDSGAPSASSGSSSSKTIVMIKNGKILTSERSAHIIVGELVWVTVKHLKLQGRPSVDQPHCLAKHHRTLVSDVQQSVPPRGQSQATSLWSSMRSMRRLRGTLMVSSQLTVKGACQNLTLIVRASLAQVIT